MAYIFAVMSTRYNNSCMGAPVLSWWTVFMRTKVKSKMSKCMSLSVVLGGTQLYNCHCLKYIIRQPKSSEEMPQTPPRISIAHRGVQRAETLGDFLFHKFRHIEWCAFIHWGVEQFLCMCTILTHKVKVCEGDNAFPQSPICNTCIKWI